MADIYDFNERKKQKEECDTKPKQDTVYFVQFDDVVDDDTYIEFTFTPEDLNLDLNDKVEETLSKIEQELQTSHYREHIANLIEIVSYNIDWTKAPDWHKDMYERAVQFYDDCYGKER